MVACYQFSAIELPLPNIFATSLFLFSSLREHDVRKSFYHDGLFRALLSAVRLILQHRQNQTTRSVCYSLHCLKSVAAHAVTGEPPEAGWNDSLDACVASADSSCHAEGCSDVPNPSAGMSTAEPRMKSMETLIQASDEGSEHLAGPHCICTAGYSGWRISVAEMRVSTSVIEIWAFRTSDTKLEKDRISVQCLSVKPSDWMPESGDEDFEREASHCFVTGISTQAVDEFDISGLEPVKHGVAEGMINNVVDDYVGLIPDVPPPLVAAY